MLCDEDISPRIEDISPRIFRPISIYADYPGDLTNLPTEVIDTVLTAMEQHPTAWTPRLIYSELRRQGRSDISEALINRIMTDARAGKLFPQDGAR